MKHRTLKNRQRMEMVMRSFLYSACHDDEIVFSTRQYPSYISNFGVNGKDYYRGSKRVTLYYNLDLLFDNTKYSINVIMGDMNRRSKTVNGFSRITKILLHELGHLATCVEVYGKNGENFDAIMKQRERSNSNSTYLKIPDEYAATEWALNWLEKPENRTIAYKFEKRFWACFA